MRLLKAEEDLRKSQNIKRFLAIKELELDIVRDLLASNNLKRKTN